VFVRVVSVLIAGGLNDAGPKRSLQMFGLIWLSKKTANNLPLIFPTSYLSMASAQLAALFALSE